MTLDLISSEINKQERKHTHKKQIKKDFLSFFQIVLTIFYLQLHKCLTVTRQPTLKLSIAIDMALATETNMNYKTKSCVNCLIV